MSFFTVYGKNNQNKIIKILKDLCETNDEGNFLEVFLISYIN